MRENALVFLDDKHGCGEHVGRPVGNHKCQGTRGRFIGPRFLP